MEEPFEFSAKVEEVNLRRFSLYVHYHRTMGIIMTIGAVSLLAGVIIMYPMGRMFLQDAIVFSLAGLFLLLFPPLRIAFVAKMLMRTQPVYAEPLHFSLEKEGIRMYTNMKVAPGEKTEDKLRWEKVYKIVSTKTNLMIFSSQVVAWIIPMKDITAEYPTIKEICRRHVEEHRLVLR